MAEALSTLAILAIALASWLLPKYLAARVTEAARGAVDEHVGKALADHAHELDKQLEVHRNALARQADEFRHLLAQETARYSQDYGLFASRRNEVYAETYASFERARGGFAPHFSPITIGPTWDNASGADILKFGRSEHVSEGERAELSEYVEKNQLDQARTFAATLYERVSLRQAHEAFRDFKNTIVLNALYYSPDVDRVLTEATTTLARMAAAALDVEHLERLRLEHKEPLLRDTDAMSSRLRGAMRDDMQAGFNRAHGAA